MKVIVDGTRHDEAEPLSLNKDGVRIIVDGVEQGGGPEPPEPLPYDAEVEYLESTGTQYIATNVSTAQTLEFEVSAMPLAQGFWFVRAGDNFSTNILGFYISTGAYNETVFRYSGTQVANGRNGLNHINSVSYRGGVATLDGEAIDVSFAYTWTFPYSLFLANGAAGRIYSAKFGHPSILADFIPVRVGSGSSAVGYLYDRANPTGGPLGNGLYGNAADGQGGKAGFPANCVGPDKQGA